MALDERKHTVPDGAEHPSRAAIIAAFESVNDIVPVANATERATVAAAVAPTAARPLFVYRANAAPGRKVEVTENGTTWSQVPSGLIPGGGIIAGQGVVEGTPPSGDTQAIIKSFSRIVTTNASGDATIVFPGPAFPSGVATVVPASGDVIAGNHAYCGLIDVDLTSVNVRCFQPGGAVCANVSVRINIVAVGW